MVRQYKLSLHVEPLHLSLEILSDSSARYIGRDVYSPVSESFARSLEVYGNTLSWKAMVFTADEIVNWHEVPALVAAYKLARGLS